MSNFQIAKVSATVLGLSVLCGAALGAQPAMDRTTMAPVSAYLMSTDDEINLARSAAPWKISANATVLVLRRSGYHRVVNGTNGFVCVVFRSWTAGSDDPDFWNPKLRSPLCLNAPAASTYLPLMELRTRLILEGKSKTAAFASVSLELRRGQLRGIAPGAMSYMLSKDQYVASDAKNWHPHLMFFVPGTASPSWGAGVPGSPIIESADADDQLTIFLVPVTRWSDGSVAAPFP